MSADSGASPLDQNGDAGIRSRQADGNVDALTGRQDGGPVYGTVDLRPAGADSVIAAVDHHLGGVDAPFPHGAHSCVGARSPAGW